MARLLHLDFRHWGSFAEVLSSHCHSHLELDEEGDRWEGVSQLVGERSREHSSWSLQVMTGSNLLVDAERSRIRCVICVGYG
jgi:hypothetical protein